MPNVVFVAPFLMPATLSFVEATANLPGVRLGLLSQQPAEHLPSSLRHRLAAHWRVDNALDAQQLADGTRQLQRVLGGPIHRLFGALEQLQVPLGEVRDSLGIEGMGADAANNFRDKARMKTALRQAGLPCARHRLVTSLKEAKDFALEVGFPMVVKPPDGAGAKATFRVDSTEALLEALDLLRPTPGREALLEEFITGEEFSFETLSIRGRPVWSSVSHYQPTPLEVLRNPWIQWCVLLPKELEDPQFAAIHQAGPQALQTLGMGTGLSHMEWFRRSDGSIAISEVGARPPGAQITTLLSYAHDTNFKAVWSHLMVFDELKLPPRQWATGAAFLRGQGIGKVKDIEGLDRAQKELGPLVVETKLPRAGQSPASGYEGEGYVILRHPETKVVEQALRRLVSLVRVRLA
ncbi:MAG: ATP-grasp domain-containing protein [Deltaproteobacteria bacterium]|nr:ATP-grasp domain-containing protein [Deltaproteobacteria bacterium]